MEGIENIGQDGNVVLRINDQAKRSLEETAKWAKLLSIVGFVGIGFIILLAVFMAFFMNSVSDLSPELAGMGGMMGVGMSVLYLIIAAIYFYPVWKLYQFAILTKSALNTENADLLANALEAQKSMFKFMGIFTIIIFGIYGLMFAIFGTALLGNMF